MKTLDDILAASQSLDREDLDQDSWLEEQMEYSTEVVQYVEIDGRRYPRPIRKVPTSLRRKQSDSSLTGSSDRTKRESKSVAYRDTRYTTLLAAKGSFTEKSDLGITDANKSLCRPLLESAQDVPKHSLFRNDLFEKTCRKIQDTNEARVITGLIKLLTFIAIFSPIDSSHNIASAPDKIISTVLQRVVNVSQSYVRNV